MDRINPTEITTKMPVVSNERITKLKTEVLGEVMLPGNDGYDKARTVWNAMTDRHPAVIVRCVGESDVKAAVNFARENKMILSIKGGGHHIAGNAVCDHGLMIDLSGMRTVRIDPDKKIAYVGGGALLSDFDEEAQKYGLATPLGINSTTGVAGLTLGGGFGWLSRKYGMTVDNLLAADVVTADGKSLRATETENPDLFWALRGGSGNFGVVTRFEYKLYPVGPEVLSGLVIYPMSETTSVLKQYREYVKTLGDDTAVWVVLRLAPPLPFLPEKVHGTPILALAVFHAGDPEQGRKTLEPLRKFGTVLGEAIGMNPYVGWQKAFDALLGPGARNYWKSHNLTEISDDMIDVTLRYASNLPDPQSDIFFGQIGGATTRPAPDATAYSHRKTIWALNVHCRWEDPAKDGKCINWAREFFQKSLPYAAPGVYVNFLTEDEIDRVKTAYGPSYERLLSIKKKYDPNNLFCMNLNINPVA